MDRYNNKTDISITIKSEFSFNNIRLFFLKVSDILGAVEYVGFRPENTENLLPEEFIANTEAGKSRSIRFIWDETGCEFYFFHNKRSGFSISVYRFGNYLETDAGFKCKDAFKESCGEKVFDTRHYLTILLDLCEDLIVEDIKHREDDDKGDLFSPKPITNTLAATFGFPILSYWLSDDRTYGDYFKTMIKNMRKSDAIVIHNLQEDLLEKDIAVKKYLTLSCTWHDYNLHLYFNSLKELIIKPIHNIKCKILDSAEIVDAAFYTRFLLCISEGLNIKDFETYFNRPDYVYHLEDYR